MPVDDIDIAAFGQELRRRRIAAGLSLNDLATRTHFSKGYLSRVELGQQRPTDAVARACDGALGAGGALVALAAAVRPAQPAPAKVDMDGELNTLLRVLIGEGRIRESFAAPSGPPLDQIAIAQYRVIFTQLRLLGQTTSPALHLPSIKTFVARLVAAGITTGHGATLVLASRYAEYAGWMAQELGHDVDALQWTALAVKLAQTAGDEKLTAYSFVRRSLIALYRHDADQTVSLARAAQRWPFPRIRGLAAQHEAQGYAIAGDYDACLRSLDRAASYMAQAQAAEAEDPVLGTSTVPDSVAIVTGWCLHDLGRPHEAVDILVAELERVPETARRYRARYTVRLARALAEARQVDEACAVVTPTLANLAALDSATIRTDLARLADTLKRWPARPSVHALMPDIRRSLRTNLVA